MFNMEKCKLLIWDLDETKVAKRKAESNIAILVKGGAGYIRSHTCVELLNAGKGIVLLDNFMNSNEEVINRIHKITGKTFPVYAVDINYRRKQ